MMSTYPDVQLYVGGEWRVAAEGATLPILNPATGETLATLARAGREDLDAALDHAAHGFAQ